MVNIAICGTPGTGKSTLVESIKSQLNNNPSVESLNFINITKLAIDNDCTDGYDAELDTHIIDEDKLIECLQVELSKHQHSVIECIHADMLVKDWVQWVFVCHTDNKLLFDRLTQRGYSELKITNNIDAEIFQTISEEAVDFFGSQIVTNLTCDTQDDLAKNTIKVVNRLESLCSQKGE